jgi:hypothetical protein
MDDRSILDRMRAELDELRAENRELKARVDRLQPPSPLPGQATRRGALTMAAGVAGGVLATTLGAAAPAQAAGGNSLVLGEGNGADVPTGLEVTGTAVPYGFGITDNGLSQVPEYFPSLLGHADDVAFHTGILGYVSSGAAVATAISALSDETGASCDLCGPEGNGVTVVTQGGSGVYALCGGDAVYGVSENGSGVHGVSSTGFGPAVLAEVENGTGNALEATSAGGRGIVSSGKLAQLQLTPGKQASHPKAGDAGDLFVDKSARLWFCKVGGATATWKQIA